MSRQLLLVTIAALTIVASIIWMDQPLAMWIEAHQTEWLSNVGSWLEEAGKSHWVLIYCIIMIAITWRSTRSIAYKFLALFASVAASGILANLIKVIVCRPRPPLFIQQGITQWNVFGFQIEYIWNSFPSGHATTGLAIAISGSAIYPHLRWLFWSIGIAIALGRLAINAHYLSDVVAGGLLGAVVALVVNVILVKKIRV